MKNGWMISEKDDEWVNGWRGLMVIGWIDERRVNDNLLRNFYSALWYFV